MARAAAVAVGRPIFGCPIGTSTGLLLLTWRSLLACGRATSLRRQQMALVPLPTTSRRSASTWTPFNTALVKAFNSFLWSLRVAAEVGDLLPLRPGDSSPMLLQLGVSAPPRGFGHLAAAGECPCRSSTAQVGDDPCRHGALRAGLVPIGGHASSLLGGRVCRLIRLLALGPLRRTLPVPFRVLLFAPPSAPSPELGLAGAVPSGRVVLSPFL